MAKLKQIFRKINFSATDNFYNYFDILNGFKDLKYFFSYKKRQSSNKCFGAILLLMMSNCSSLKIYGVFICLF